MSWLSFESISNKLKQTYLKGFLDVSGDLTVREGDVSMNQRLYVHGDVSMNQRLDIGGDVSMNQHLEVNGDVSFNLSLIHI